MKKYSLLVFVLLILASCGKDEPPKTNPDNTNTPEVPDNPGNPGNPENPENPDQPVDPSVPYFSININDEISYTKEQSTMSWEIDTNIDDWTAVSSDESWCKVEKQTGQSWILSITTESYDTRFENGGYDYTKSPRHCTVTITAGSTYKKVIDIYQDPKVYFNINAKEYYGSMLSYALHIAPGASAEVNVVTNCHKWVVESESDWIKVEKRNHYSFRISTSELADGAEKRNGSIILHTDNDSYNVDRIFVHDTDALLDNENYNYGEHFDWE